MFTRLSKSERDEITAASQRGPRYDPDLDTFRDPRDASRFVCVYPMGRDRWRARVLKRINIHTYPTQLDAAKAVLEFYRRVFGDQWKTAFRRRKVNPWRIKKIKRDGVSSYVADVYVDGQPVRVSLADTKRFTGAACAIDERLRMDERNRRKPWAKELDIYFWYTREDARRAIKRFCYHQLGMLAPFRLWRS